LCLEGLVYLPDVDGLLPGVVVCHPHPFYGGSMDNKVVDSICEALIAKSIIALKFNFRGVGGSEGQFRIGTEPQEDVKAAVSFLISLKEVDAARIGVAGYSAGSAWGLAFAYQSADIKALAAISPPLSMFDFDILLNSQKPKLMISGDHDEHVPKEAFLDFCEKLSEPKECDVIEGADHFWRGYETAMAETVAHYFGRTL
jgi:uncharacterized protein